MQLSDPIGMEKFQNALPEQIGNRRCLASGRAAHNGSLVSDLDATVA